MSVPQSLWRQLISFENLFLAWRKARRGKSGNPRVAQFELDLENELLVLQQALSEGSYLPGKYELFTLYERKARIIAVAPFRDRVVHHALMNVVEPIFDKVFIDYSYACRKGKGVHAAVDQYQTWSRQYRYALKLDIQSYFPSIEHTIIKKKIGSHLRDKNILNLFDKIIDSACTLNKQGEGKGLPIGNLTSQCLANLYLNEVDHWVREDLKISTYLRYVDDMFLLSNSKYQLHQAREALSDRLSQENLKLHERKWQLVPVQAGLDVLGYRVWPYKRRLRNDNVYRFSRRLRKMAKHYAQGKLNWGDFNPSVQSWLGHARHANTWRLRNDIFSKVVFRRVQNIS